MASIDTSIYEIKGAVLDIVGKSKDPKSPSITFTLKTVNGRTLKIFCPFFCPVSPGDGFFGVGRLEDEYNVRIVRPPLATIPMDKDNTLQFFIRTLKGTKFGQVSAIKLYEELETLAKEFRYGKDFQDGFNPSITPESRYYGDGVIAFLGDYSADYCVNRSEKIISVIAGKTINKPQAKKLLEEWHNKRSLRKLYLLGLTRNEITFSGKNLEELYKICLENPYRIPSIHYEKCEKILLSVGKFPTDEQKDCGRINRFVYDNSSSKGWMCTPGWILRRALPKYDTYQELLTKEYDLVDVNDKVYTTYNYKVESTVSNYINELILDTAHKFSEVQTPSIKTQFYECKTLTEEQKRAIDFSLRSKVSIIAGGAGTGKSTIIREIVRNLSMRGIQYILAAFTGKAVSRLHEIIRNKSAGTIDRHITKIKERLANDPKYDKSGIQYIIIDEISMVTTELFYRLITQINQKVCFILVGDHNQLPPIGCGSLMKELMNSKRVPIFYLTQNQRILPSTHQLQDGEIPGSQEFDRCILENANQLIDKTRNRKVPMIFKEGSGFYILEGSKETVRTILLELYKAKVESDKIVIISPYKAPLSDLNAIFQEVYFGETMDATNSYFQPCINGGRQWCIGDRVMMTVNNYKINVMNGEQGKVVGIEDKGVKVQFDDGVSHLFTYSSGEIDPEKELEDIDENSSNNELYVDYLAHSFAISCHKSQGSEYEYVILYIPEDRSFSNFMNINLLYTAITRTKRTIWVVGNKETLYRTSITEMPSRNDGLATMLRSQKNIELEKILEIYTQAPEFVTGSQLSTTLTTTPDSFDTIDDLYELYQDDF